MPSSHLILCRPLLLLPPIPPSIRVFSNESTLHMRWPKYWSFSFSIIPSKEIPGLISFRMDWLDLLAVQGTLESLLEVLLHAPEALAGVLRHPKHPQPPPFLQILPLKDDKGKSMKIQGNDVFFLRAREATRAPTPPSYSFGSGRKGQNQRSKRPLVGE